MGFFDDVVGGVVAVVAPITVPVTIAVDILRKAGGDVGDVVNKTDQAAQELVSRAGKLAEQTFIADVQIAAAPTIALVELIKGDPKAANASIKAAAQAFVDATAQGAVIASTPYVLVGQITRNLGGDSAVFLRGYLGLKLVEVNVAPFLAKRLLKNGQSPLELPQVIVGSPLEALLAAFIEAAAATLLPVSRTIPDAIRLAMSPYFKRRTLDNARYFVGPMGFTLPEAVNGFESFMGNHANAVTTSNIITFSIEPVLDAEGLHWWAHELAHVEQYEILGIDGFAAEYVKNYKYIEDRAEQKAQTISRRLNPQPAPTEQVFPDTIEISSLGKVWGLISDSHALYMSWPERTKYSKANEIVRDRAEYLMNALTQALLRREDLGFGPSIDLGKQLRTLLKTPAAKPVPRKVSSKKVPVKEALTKDIAAKKVAVNKALAKKIASKKAPAKKAPARKVAIKKVAVKKAPD